MNSLAKSSFAVYLIHENPFIRPYLEKYIPDYYDFSSVWFPLQFISIMILIWTVCTFIDYGRRYIFRYLEKMSMHTRIDDVINKY